jgi:hypothetical protein
MAVYWGVDCFPAARAATPSRRPPVAAVPSSQRQAAPVDADNAVTRAAAAQGVRRCLERVQQVSAAFGFTPQAGALLMIPPTEPDRRVIPLAMEIPTQSGSVYIGADFAPDQANGCGVSADTIVYWKQSCKVVASRNFASLKAIGTLRKDITVLDDGGLNVKVLLMPADKGCISIKKEVVL